MLNKSKNIALICGAVSMTVTIIFYLLTFNNIFIVPMQWLSLVFLILAEAIGTIKAFTFKKSIFGVSNITTSIIHVIVVLIVSIIFVNIFPLLINRYILLNILALCILLIVDVLMAFFTNHITTQNSKLDHSQSIMGCCVEKGTSLCVEFNDTEYKNELEEIVELLKYADNSCLSHDEINIVHKLDELQLLLKNNDEGISEKIIEIKNEIKLRSIKVSSTKRGNY